MVAHRIATAGGNGRNNRALDCGFSNASIFGSERLTGALLDRLTHHVHILEMNGESYRLAASKKAQRRSNQEQRQNAKAPNQGDPATEL